MKHSQFYYNVYSIIDTQKEQEQLNNEKVYNLNASYIKMKYDMDKFEPEYEKLIFYALDIDKYLNIPVKSIDNDDIKRIISISKMNYAEAKIAFELQAIYWRAYNSGIDNKAFKLFLSEENEYLKKYSKMSLDNLK